MDIPSGVMYTAIGGMAAAIVALFAFVKWAVHMLERANKSRIDALEEHCARLEKDCERLDKAREACEADRMELHRRIEDQQARQVDQFAEMTRFLSKFSVQGSEKD